MDPFVQSITNVLSLGIVVINIFSIILIVVLILRLAGVNIQPAQKIYAFVSKHALVLSFLGAFGAVVGSLFYSLVAHFIPCELCWWQRAFLFPQAIIFAIAFYRSWMYKAAHNDVFLYGIALSLVGAAIALFHYYGAMFNPDLLSACEVGGVSCAKQYFLSFGYINIPFMSLSTFVFLGAIGLIRTLDK
jgi:disulfide bond formation protein DsbB